MKKTTKKVTKKSTIKPGSSALADFTTIGDLKSAVLLVSLLINLFILCLWIVVQITSQYDQALFEFFVNR